MSAPPQRVSASAVGIKQHLLTLGGALLLGLAAVLVFVYGDSVRSLRDELQSWGVWSVIAFIGLETVWMLTTVPAVPLMLLAGSVYGVWLGTLYSTIGGMIGSSLIFVVGRSLGRVRLLALSRNARGVKRALKLIERHPVASIVVVRALPMFPLNLLNYVFGATQVSFRLYFLVSFLMLAPAAAFYAGLGKAILRAAFGEGIPLTEVAWLAVFALLSAAVIWYARRRAGASDAE